MKCSAANLFMSGNLSGGRGFQSKKMPGIFAQCVCPGFSVTRNFCGLKAFAEPSLRTLKELLPPGGGIITHVSASKFVVAMPGAAGGA